MDLAAGKNTTLVTDISSCCTASASFRYPATSDGPMGDLAVRVECYDPLPYSTRDNNMIISIIRFAEEGGCVCKESHTRNIIVFVSIFFGWVGTASSSTSSISFWRVRRLVDAKRDQFLRLGHQARCRSIFKAGF